jgi:hypothetical protein
VVESHVTEILESEDQSIVTPHHFRETRGSKEESGRCNSEPDEKNSVGTVFREARDYSHLGMG